MIKADAYAPKQTPIEGSMVKGFGLRVARDPIPCTGRLPFGLFYSLEC